MSDTPVVSEEVATPAQEDGATGDDLMVEEELLVQEVSIDGMCGVY